MKIGLKIKTLRMLYGLTQEELADRCELTKGYISQLENDVTEPSISTLEDILNALGTNFKEFFNDCDNEQVVFKEDDYFIKEHDKFSMKWLVFNSQKNEMEPLLFTIYPGKESDLDIPHEGQEFGYVLEGSIELIYGNNHYIINQGETFYFTADKNHYLKNNGPVVAKLIWVSSPPNF
jgi:transcriptional regulator with XRE-family HTH domain